MTGFHAKVSSFERNRMLHICDEDLIGKEIREGDLTMKITSDYFGNDRVGRGEAEALLGSSGIINMAGDEITALSIRIGIGSRDGIKMIGGVPFLIVFK